MTRLYGARPPAEILTLQPAVSAVLIEAHQRLSTAAYVELHSIQCQFEDGTLTLTGTVTRYHLKQCAYHVVAGLVGVQRVCNEVSVDWYASSNRLRDPGL